MIAHDRLLQELTTAVWVYDFDSGRIIWSNRAALELWNAASHDELAERDLVSNMAPKVVEKLAQYREDFRKHDATFAESWTLYPHSLPRRIDVDCSGYLLEDGRIAMLVQARPGSAPAPDSLRAVEALNHTNVMISLFERGGGRLYCNPAARTVFGGAEPAFRDRFEDPAEADAFLQAIETDGTAGTIYRVAGGGRAVWHHVFGAPCRDAVTGRNAYLFSESDVTLAQEAQAALETAHTDAVRTTRLKTDFLARMSHEIRTPVNGVIGAADLLEERISDPADRELLTMVVESGEALLRVVNGVLDLSKIEAGGLDLEIIEFSPAELGEKVRRIQGAKAHEQGTRLTIECAPDAEKARLGDPHRILQILNNLVSNAIRFARGGQVIVQIDDPASGPLVLSVRDDGIGMTEAQLARVFESYKQAEASTTRQYGGTGLGMPIARGLADVMGGRIDIESAPGQGTSVTVTLPLAFAGSPDGAPRAAEAEPSATPTRGIKVLAADDDATNRLVLENMAGRLGLDVTVVRSGREVIEHIRATSVDLLMLDISMPELDGMATLAAVREMETADDRPATPAIAVTANVFQHQINTYLEAGFLEHLAKPLRLDEMSACIERALGVNLAR